MIFKNKACENKDQCNPVAGNLRVYSADSLVVRKESWFSSATLGLTFQNFNISVHILRWVRCRFFSDGIYGLAMKRKYWFNMRNNMRNLFTVISNDF